MSEPSYFDIIRSIAGEVRQESFVKACAEAFSRKHRWFIETGCYRGIPADGQSTKILAMMARWTQGRFFSCNINADDVAKARELIVSICDDFRIDVEDSVKFLSKIPWIDFLYLDSYDYDEKNPLPSQMHMLAELGAAYGKLSPKSLILLDDCNIPGGGKGLLTDLFLKERGWKLLHDGYQKLFTL